MQCQNIFALFQLFYSFFFQIICYLDQLYYTFVVAEESINLKETLQNFVSSKERIEDAPEEAMYLGENSMIIFIYS